MNESFFRGFMLILVSACLGLLVALTLFAKRQRYALLPPSPPAVERAADIPRWEYMLASPTDLLFDRDMKEYGAQGWELVSARRASTGPDMGYEIIMKRPQLPDAAWAPLKANTSSKAVDELADQVRFQESIRNGASTATAT